MATRVYDKDCDKCGEGFETSSYYRTSCEKCFVRKKAVAENKVCVACDEIYSPSSSRQLVCTTCTPTKGWQARYRRYKITKPMFDKMLAEQKNKCVLCLEPFVTELDTCLDHCHSTGNNRGILCRGCNMVVSRFEDAEYVARVERYLGGDFAIASEKETEDIRRV